jgi:hypothetical protein
LVEKEIMSIDVWIIHSQRVILVTDDPGVPMAVCSYVSEEARDTALARGYGTVSEIGFPKDVYFGPFPEPEGGGWGEAGQIAEAKAKELGYRVEYSSIIFSMFDDEGDEDFYDEPDWDDDFEDEEE